MSLENIHSVKPLWDRFSFLIVTLFLTGCYGASTQHYFAMADLNDPNPELTFYRVTITANSFLTSSQIRNGFYDADALHQLFGEVKKPDSPAASTVNVRPGTQNLECDVIGNCLIRKDGANDRFTVIFGADAAAVAKQIQSFSNNDNAGKGIAALLAASTSADAFIRTTAADQNTDQTKKNAAALAKQLKSLADQIATAGSADAVRKILLQAAQVASQKAGSSAIFDTSDIEKGFTQAQTTYDALPK